MLILLYIFIAYTGIKFLVAMSNLLTQPVLRLNAAQNFPKVKISVLIPARNEVNKIGSLLQSLLKQDYKNIEILVLDDGSSDGTAEVVERFALDNPNIKLIKGKAVPKGWLGKNYACFQLANAAKGDFYFFLDADVIVNKQFFQACLNKIESSNISMLSVFNDQKMNTIGECLTVPLMHYILLALLPLKLVQKSSNPTFAAASGQCMVFRKSNYEKEKWHKVVKGIVTEDIAIFKVAKKKGYTVSAVLAGGFITCRMYQNFKSALNGFSKNLLAGFENSILGLLVFTFLENLFWIFVFQKQFSLVLLGTFSLIILMRVIISLLGRQNLILNVLLHPVQVIVLLIIAFISIYKKLTRSNRWKGRLIDLQSA